MDKILRLIPKRFRRLTGFGFVGAFVFLAGMGLLALLVEVCRFQPGVAYFITAVFSIETNFLLNKLFVWKDKPGGFWHHWGKFHITRLVTFPLNQLVFNFMIAAGFTWIVATVTGLVISTAVNFLGLDGFVFRVSVPRGPDFPAQIELDRQLSVSVVIPARNEAESIRGCIKALLAQDFLPYEIIVVTEPGDPTAGAIKDLVDHRQVRHVEFVRPGGIQAGKRDTNARRYQGLLAACGDILVLTDAKIRMPKDWLRKIVFLLAEQGNEAVAGITTRMPGDDSFFAVLSDEGFLRENTRFTGPLLTLENYGRVQGLPVTANLAFKRWVFESIRHTFPTQGFLGWEDFALTSTILQAGFGMRTTNELVVYRTHKPTMRLAKHAVTGIAAWVFRQQHKQNAFVKNRHKMAVLTTLILLAGLGFVLGVAFFFGWLQALYASLSMCGAGFAFLGIYNVYLARDVRAFVFPPIILLQVATWTFGYWIGALFRGKVPAKITEILKSLRMLFLTLVR